MKRIARSWLVQQAHKRECTCPAWWMLELYNVLTALYIDILEREE